MEPEIGAKFTVTFHADGHETIRAFILYGWWEYNEAIIAGVLPLFGALGVLIPVLSRRAAQRCSVVERLRQE